ncbi:EVE domain-containing protein [Candidatus Kapaibacterium sp.]
MAYWLVKTDPDSYSWDNLVKDKKVVWDGVRNYQARNNLMKMLIGDEVLVYESQSPKIVTGITTVTKEYFPDPTTEDNAWVAVELKFKKSFKKHVSLEDIKSLPELGNIALIRQSRLSVMPLTADEFEIICSMGK